MAIGLADLLATALVAGGGGAAIAFGLFKWLGAKWLEHRFSARLQDLKHAHNTEVEHLRFRIATLLDRTTKLNQREFEVLPDIWSKAHDAHYAALSLIRRFIESVDLTNMAGPQFEWFVARSELHDWQKDELRAKGKFERSTYYADAMRWREINQALGAAQGFSQAVSRHSIYLHPDTFARLDSFAGRVREVVRTWQLDAQFRFEGSYEKPAKEDDVAQRYRETGQADFDALGIYLRDRYWEKPSLA